MAAAKVVLNDYAPYANPNDETSKDTVTANNGNVEVQVTFKLVGSVAQVQADWATLIAATITANSSSVGWGAGH